MEGLAMKSKAYIRMVKKENYIKSQKNKKKIGAHLISIICIAPVYYFFKKI